VRRNATLGIGIVLLGAGASLVFGTNRSVSAIEVSLIGLILMVLGAVIALASLLARARAASGGDAPEQRVRHLRIPPDTRRSNDDDRWPDAAGPPQ
jgi:multisubunit Na+/H+ antiporter MnhG subunit